MNADLLTDVLFLDLRNRIRFHDDPVRHEVAQRAKLMVADLDLLEDPLQVSGQPVDQLPQDAYRA